MMLRRDVNEILMKMNNESQTMTNSEFEPIMDSKGFSLKRRKGLPGCRIRVVLGLSS